MSPASEGRELRAKYLDWCSARLADRFLALTPDEIYELAERAGHGREDVFVASGVSAAAGAELAALIPRDAVPSKWRDADSFRVLVARVTEVLAETLNLPDFEEWAAAYKRSPAEYDRELLGFWKESLNE